MWSVLLHCLLCVCFTSSIYLQPKFTLEYDESCFEIKIIEEVKRKFVGKSVNFKASSNGNTFLIERKKHYSCLPVRDVEETTKYEGDQSIVDLVRFLNLHTNWHIEDRSFGEFLEALKRNTVKTGNVCERRSMEKLTSSNLLDLLLRQQPVVFEKAAKTLSDQQTWNLENLVLLSGNKRIWAKVSDSKNFEGSESAHLWWKNDEILGDIPKEVKNALNDTKDLVVARPFHYSLLFKEFAELLRNKNCSNATYYLEYFPSKSVFPAFEKPELLNLISLNLKHENVWLGDGNTVGKCHFDEYDNFMAVIRGKKRFILFDNSRNERLYERHIREGTLSFNANTCQFSRDDLPEQTTLVMTPVDISNVNGTRFPLFFEAKSTICDVNEGDILFVPSFFWHEVISTPSADSMSLAVNWWFDPLWLKEFPCAECRPYLNRKSYENLLRERYEYAREKEL